jgi:hypothetical protein
VRQTDLWPVIALSTAFAYCPVTNRGWPGTDFYVSEN